MPEIVLIRLIGTKAQIDKAFYCMIVNGNSYSNQKNEFFMEKELMLILKEEGHRFKQLSKRK